MAESELNVAIVALVISLIALLVTTQQLLVQVFGSADGYRQCAESVIGAWHKKRKRVWKWSEFRFETQYVTPQIVLMTPYEHKSDCFEEFDHVYRISNFAHTKGLAKELDVTVHTQRMRSRSDTQVTWLRLLRELHALTHSYWPAECSTCSGLAHSPADAIEVGNDSSKSWDISYSTNILRTEIGVIYRTWNWGFMPAELTRPLAEVGMGDIVVLALRMGMQWRALDLDSGRMQADGNGFNLTGFEARGLGIVLRLTATEQHSQYRKLIPSRAVDKMLMGILPGDPYLVGRDFPLVKKDRTVQPLGDPQGILAAIMPKEHRETMAAMDYTEVRIDVITLLLAYLPLDGCTMTRYAFPGWNTNPTYRNVYCYWEGRLALHRALRKRVDSGVLGGNMHKVLSNVLMLMDRLEDKYTDDWYIRLDRPRVMRNQLGVDKKKECMADTAKIYAWTQTWLHQQTFKQEGQYRPDYTVLVAAHAYMASHAIKAAKDLFLKEFQNQSQQSLRDRYDVNEPKYGSRFNHEMYGIACHYVEHLRDDAHGFHVYLKGDGWTNIDADTNEATWWVMQLRGIVWHFSTWHPETIVQEVLGEQLIPSTFYGNKSPVWIT